MPTPTFQLPSQPLISTDPSQNGLVQSLNFRFAQINRQMQNIVDGVYEKGQQESGLGGAQRALIFYTLGAYPVAVDADFSTPITAAYTSAGRTPRTGDTLVGDDGAFPRYVHFLATETDFLGYGSGGAGGYTIFPRVITFTINTVAVRIVQLDYTP